MVISSSYIRKDKRSHKWYAVVKFKDETGKWRSMSKSTGIRCYPDDSDKAQWGSRHAQAWMEHWVKTLGDEAEGDTAASGEETPEKPATFVAYCDAYNQAKADAQIVAYGTINGYRAVVSKIRGTALGEAGLHDVDARLIEEWEAGLVADGYSAAVRSKAHVYVKSVLRWAVRHGDLERNPAELVEAPKRPRRPINVLDRSGIRVLSAVLDVSEGEAFATAVSLALRLGLRRGEVCGLRWLDVDLDRGEVRIQHSMARTRKHGPYELVPPKTLAGQRTIPIGDEVKSILEHRRAVMLQDRCMLGKWDESLFVCGDVAGHPYNPEVLGHEWRRFASALQLRGSQGDILRYHDLRHCFASYAIAEGVDPKTVSVCLGHSSISMTMDVYADALGDAKRAGMERIDKMFAVLTA